jgi:hypothetical protein
VFYSEGGSLEGVEAAAPNGTYRDLQGRPTAVSCSTAGPIRRRQQAYPGVIVRPSWLGVLTTDAPPESGRPSVVAVACTAGARRDIIILGPGRIPGANLPIIIIIIIIIIVVVVVVISGGRRLTGAGRSCSVAVDAS